MCLLPLTIFHNGGIDDSHLFHKKEPFTYSTPRSANLHRRGNVGSIGALQHSECFTTEGQKFLLITQDYYIILKKKKKHLREIFSLLGSPDVLGIVFFPTDHSLGQLTNICDDIQVDGTVKKGATDT